MLKNIKFLYTGANPNHMSYFNDDLNIHINVDFHYLSNETTPGSVAITVLEL